MKHHIISAIALLSALVGCTKHPSAIARVQVIDSSIHQDQILNKLKGSVGPSVSISPINGTKLFTIKATANNTSEALSTMNNAITNLKDAFRRGSQEGLVVVDPPTLLSR